MFRFPNVLRFVYIYSGYAMLFVFIGIESSVLFVGLLYISFMVDCEIKKRTKKISVLLYE